MPTTTWNTTFINGIEYLVIESAQFRVPKDFDPTSNMFIAVAAPTGGLGAFPALVKGDKGDAPTINAAINVTFLEPGDPTVDSASWTETSPDEYSLNLVIHKGPQGMPGDTVLDVDDFGTPLPGKLIVVNATMDGFEYQSPKIGGRYPPGSIANTPTGNPNFTLCAVSIPAQPFDWRPVVEGWCVISPGWFDTVIDLVARLNNETSGNEVGRGPGWASGNFFGVPTIVVNLSSALPTNASSTYDKVSAGASAVVYLRAERQSGSATFTTVGTSTRFTVRVDPIP